MRSDIIDTYGKVANQITQEVSSAWGKQTDLISQTILAGGGAVMLKEYLSFPNIITPSDPVFANAEGFLHMLSGQLLREKAE